MPLVGIACSFSLFGFAMLASAQETDSKPTTWEVLKGDSRLAAPRSLDSYFPFTVPPDLATWETRKATLQDRLKTILGLQPEPPRPALEPVISEPLMLEGYSVSKVRFESMPGFFVTGSLYRPVPKTPAEPGSNKNIERHPAVLCPHGHWANGRFMYAGDDEVKRELDSGAETHECGARSPLQARCVHLARMGCVVFHYDMLGNADSVQIPASLSHGYSNRRPHLEAPDAYGLFSVRAESHFQSIMSLQTWNTIRSLDFLESLPDVDPHRIGVTGASGGGTQTFIACAIDPRPAVSFPAVMVGTAMQGGCVCENCCFLRGESGNVEIAAMFAPRPQGLTAADDWTKEMPTKGFPELQRLYDLYGVKDQVELTSRLEFGHNYNQFGRQAMYRLVARNFGLPDFPETPFRVLRDKEMSWFANAENEGAAPDGGSSQPRYQPETGEAFEVKLLQWWQSAIQQSWTKMQDELIAAGGDKDGQLDKWRTRMRGIYLCSEYRLPTNLHWTPLAAPTPLAPSSPWQRSEWLLEDQDRKAMVPVLMLEAVGSPASAPPQADRICMYFGDRADKLLDETGQPQPWVVKRLEAGQRVIAIDMFGQGRFATHAGFKMDDRWQMTRRESAGYVMGYNLPLVSLRAHDVLQVLTAILPPNNNSPAAPAVMPKALDLVAEGDGVPALSVSALSWDQWAGSKAEVLIDGKSHSRLQRIELRGGDFRFAEVASLRDANFLPGSAVIGDLPGLWMLNRVPNVHVDHADEAWKRSNQVRKAVGAPSLIFQP